jgi:hypothetical protein
VLAAEQRLVDAAGRHAGYAVEASSVDLARAGHGDSH